MQGNSVRTHYKYSSNGFEIFPPSQSLILGFSDEYTAKFYRTLSIIVQEPTKVKLNDDEITLMPQTGFLNHPEYNSPIYQFSVEEPNKLIYFCGEW